MIKRLFSNTESKKFLKDAVWLLSNFAANSEKDSADIVEAGLISNLIFTAQCKNKDLRKEALYALQNLVVYSNEKEVIERLLKDNVMHLFFLVLENETIEGLEQLLALNATNQLIKKSEMARRIFEFLQGDKLLLHLQNSSY